MSATNDAELPDGLAEGLAWIDGRMSALADASLSVVAEGLLRGDGAFETIGVWDGRAFRLDDHLARLQSSLSALALPHADVAGLKQAVEALLAHAGRTDAMLRITVLAGGSTVVTLTPQPVRPAITALSSQPAPWIRPLGTFGPAGAKTLSYAPNMAALRAAQAAGADDALLLSFEGWVLEGTTFAVMWVTDGVLRTPTGELGIIDSISRRALLEAAEELGIPVEEGRWRLAELENASEVLVSSSVRPCTPVQRVDEWTYEGPGPICARIAPLLERARRSG